MRNLPGGSNENERQEGEKEATPAPGARSAAGHGQGAAAPWGEEAARRWPVASDPVAAGAVVQAGRACLSPPCSSAGHMRGAGGWAEAAGAAGAEAGLGGEGRGRAARRRRRRSACEAPSAEARALSEWCELPASLSRGRCGARCLRPQHGRRGRWRWRR